MLARKLRSQPRPLEEITKLIEAERLGQPDPNKDYTLRGVAAFVAGILCAGAFMYLWYLVSPETLFQ